MTTEFLKNSSDPREKVATDDYLVEFEKVKLTSSISRPGYTTTGNMEGITLVAKRLTVKPNRLSDNICLYIPGWIKGENQIKLLEW